MITFLNNTKFKIPKICVCCGTEDVTARQRFTGKNWSQSKDFYNRQTTNTYQSSLELFVCDRCIKLRRRYEIDKFLKFLKGLSILQVIILSVWFLLWLFAVYHEGSLSFPSILFLTTSLNYLIYYIIDSTAKR